jgi:hypothetical protein
MTPDLDTLRRLCDPKSCLVCGRLPERGDTHGHLGCGPAGGTLSFPRINLRAAILELLAALRAQTERAERAEADSDPNYAPPGTCANCGKAKRLPYRRDDLGGYVCLTCVERHLNAQKVRAEKAEVENARLREGLAYIAQIAEADVLATSATPDEMPLDGRTPENEQRFRRNLLALAISRRARNAEAGDFRFLNAALAAPEPVSTARGQARCADCFGAAIACERCGGTGHEPVRDDMHEHDGGGRAQLVTEALVESGFSATCGWCRSALTLVRPGKYQCDTCEANR